MATTRSALFGSQPRAGSEPRLDRLHIGCSKLPHRLGFGCAGLMRVASSRARQRLLSEAFDHGVRHFDVARMYGLGAAEAELGKFARGRREQLVIATKFGIETSATSSRLARVQTPARALVARSPALRATLKRRAAVFHRPHRYDPATARASLELSLRELGTDYVDILFVHDPSPRDDLQVAELGEALADLARAGYLRAWGFAGEPEPCIALDAAVTAPTVLQIRDDIFARGLRLDRDRPRVTFGILADALGRILIQISHDEGRRARWRNTMGGDRATPEDVASLLLQDALARNPSGTVLFSTTRPERIALAARAAEAVSSSHEPVPLRMFRQLVACELPPDLARHG